MDYLVEMRLAESGRSTTPAEGLTFVEQYVLPTLGLCETLARDGRIIAGGPVSGAVGLAFILRVESARELDDIVAGLPLWPRMVTTVTPLTTWSDRAAAIRPRLERLRAGKMPGEVVQSSGATQSTP